MTLSRQLITLVFVALMLVFAGSFWINLNNIRSYLIVQLATQTQNAADSLGLSLVPHLKHKDLAAMDTMINAAFDSGYYKSLTLRTMAGKILIERENTKQITGVPAWFIDLLALETPQVESVITTGWKQAGRLQLEAHAGFAYQKLWQTTMDMLWYSLLAFAIALIAVILVLKAILRPLNAVQKQAAAISRREFLIVDDIPRTKELQQVVLAMNQMSRKIGSFIGKLTNRAEQMQQQAHDDALTGLMNRRGFEAKLEHVLHDKERGGAGALAVLRLHEFAAYNTRCGHVAGDDLLRDVGQLLTTLSEPYATAVSARITGTEFAVILPALNADIASEFGAALSKALHALASTLSVPSVAHIGIAIFDHDSTMGTIMADADAGLSLAQQQGANHCVVQRSTSAVRGNIAWKNLITQALADQHIRLLMQPVLALDGHEANHHDSDRQPLYGEVLIRIKDAAGKDVSPGSFAAMAERLDLCVELDRYVLEHAIALLKADGSMPLGINLSAPSIQDKSFQTWLNSIFEQHRAMMPYLTFEMSEHAMLQDISATQACIALVHRFGGAVVMEHFGARMSSFQSLQQLKPDYLKLDGSYVRNIEAHSDNRFFLQTVVDIAQGLDMKVIAEHVENEAEWTCLKNLGIDAVQGYYLGEPEALS